MNEAADPIQERRQFTARATQQGLSQRQACRLADVARSSARYQGHPRDEQTEAQTLKEQLQRVRQKHPRFGIRRVHALISAQAQAAGKQLNHKRVQRLWRKCGFQAPQRPRSARSRPSGLCRVRQNVPITSGAMTSKRTGCSQAGRYAS